MKKIVFTLTTDIALVSCGPSEDEVKQEIVDTAIKTVCDCFEKNQSDWLAYKTECYEKVETMRIVLEDDKEGLKQFEASIEECDQYHKE